MRLRLLLAVAAVPACTLISGVGDLEVDDDVGVRAPVRPDGSDAALDAASDAVVPQPDADAGATDAGSDADAAPIGFLDDFTRADADALGNGWTEKTPGAFLLSGGAVVKVATTTSYRDNMVFRPQTDDTRDVEISIELRTASPIEFPQVFVRAQRLTVGAPGTYDGYLLYVPNDATKMILGRQRGNAFVVTLAEFTVSPAFDPLATHRIRLSARGTSPVLLDAYAERRAPNGSWEISGEVHFQDADALRIEAAGTFGFAANEQATPVYDNFRWRPL